MIPRTPVALLAAAALVVGAADASADPPKSASATAPASQPRGAVVVAVGEGAAAAARPLALSLYRDPALRPPIDDATARVLAGEPVPDNLPEDRSARLRELASLRASLGQPPPDPAGAVAPNPGAPSSDVVMRRVLAGIGAEARSELVVTVSVRAERPVARALRVSSASFEGVEIGATVQTAPDGATSYLWPGAAETLRKLMPAAPSKAAKRAPPPAKTATAAPGGPSPFASPGGGDRGKSGSFWSSPWFWVALGGVVATGVTVFVVANEVTDDGGVVHLRGTVAQ